MLKTENAAHLIKPTASSPPWQQGCLVMQEEISGSPWPAYVTSGHGRSPLRPWEVLGVVLRVTE